MRLSRPHLLAALLCLAASPAVAQDFTRRVFTYLGNDLTIDVLAEAPGVLYVTRGEPAALEVAARSSSGFTGLALGSDSEKLRLTALGADRVEYLVVVPEAVRVRVQLPDRYLAEVFGSLEGAARYVWKPGPPVGLTGQETPASAATGPYLLYFDKKPPQVVAFPDLTTVRTVRVSVEGGDFRVEADRSLSVIPGNPDLIEIRPAGPPLDLHLTVPARAGRFTLQLGGQAALRIVDGVAAVLCSPVIEQQLSDGRREFTFTPIQGRMDCPPKQVVTPARKS